ncbi:unnamed protein product [Alternaria alternata]
MTYDNWLNLWNYKVELIQSINDNPYWTRAWIIQEVALAQKVTIRLGTASVDMQHLVLGIKSLLIEKIIFDRNFASNSAW